MPSALTKRIAYAVPAASAAGPQPPAGKEDKLAATHARLVDGIEAMTTGVLRPLARNNERAPVVLVPERHH